MNYQFISYSNKSQLVNQYLKSELDLKLLSCFLNSWKSGDICVCTCSLDATAMRCPKVCHEAKEQLKSIFHGYVMEVNTDNCKPGHNHDMGYCKETLDAVFNWYDPAHSAVIAQTAKDYQSQINRRMFAIGAIGAVLSTLSLFYWDANLFFRIIAAVILIGITIWVVEINLPCHKDMETIAVKKLEEKFYAERSRLKAANSN